MEACPSCRFFFFFFFFYRFVLFFFFFFRRVFVAMSVAAEVAGGGGGHVIYLLPFLLCWSTFSTSCLLPPATATLPWRHLGNSHSPFLLGYGSLCPSLGSLSLFLFSLASLSGVPVCLLVSPSTVPLPNVEHNVPRLSRSLRSCSSTGLLFVSLVFRLRFSPPFVPCPRGPPHGAPRSPPPCKNRPPLPPPCVLSCVPGIVGNYSAQPAIPFSPVLSLRASLPSLFPPLPCSVPFPASTSMSKRQTEQDRRGGGAR